MIHVLIWLLVAMFGLGAVPQPLCHSVSEDSIISDCDYRGGTWYPRRMP